MSLYRHFFWDGRAESLEAQALGPVENPIEMGNTHVKTIETLAGIRGYQTLRDVTTHAPDMHDGSVPTLRGAVDYYNRGGNANPYMDLKMPRAPLGLSEAEIDALVAMLESLTGEGYADTAPTSFPQ